MCLVNCLYSSFQVANTVECFLKNCTEEEFIVYANDPLNDLLGDGGHASSRTGLELSFYTHKCGKSYIILIRVFKKDSIATHRDYYIYV